MTSEATFPATAPNGLDTYSRQIDELCQEIPTLYRRMQEAAQLHMQAISEGRGDFDRLAEQNQTASRTYSTLRERAVTIMREAHDVFCAEARNLRERGVPFEEDLAELWSALSVENYIPDRLVGDLLLIRKGIDNLTAAVERFEDMQQQIREVLMELVEQLNLLDRLGINTHRARLTATHLTERSQNILEPREPLLADVRRALEASRQQVSEQLARLATSTVTELHTTYDRLDALGGIIPEDRAQIQTLTDQLEHPNEGLLNLARELCTRMSERVTRRRADLSAQISNQLAVAKELRASLDDLMDEAIALDSLLKEYESVNEPQLLSYHTQLANQIEIARNAGVNALRRYEQIMSERAGDTIDTAEAHLIGTAMLASAYLPEVYAHRLWKIGEDVLLRMLLAELDIQDFYNQFGYRTIARAFAAAIDRQEFVRALNVFGIGFLPPAVQHETEQVVSVLQHADVRAVFEGCPMKPRLTKQQSEGLDDQNLRGVLTFLEHADIVGFSTETRLQWATTLLNTRAAGHDLHRRASYLLLQLLLDSNRFLSLYYALHALSEQYRELWDQPIFRAMLKPVIEQAIHLDADGKLFLVELCSHLGIERLSTGDFDTEFLLASTAHYLSTKWQQTMLLPQAWAFWERVKSEYPILCTLLLQQLNDEPIDEDVVEQDSGDLDVRLKQLVRQIEALLPSPQYKGVRLAPVVHNYYAEPIQEWLPQLTNSDVTLEQLARITEIVEVWRQAEDLVEACPHQQSPPTDYMTRLHEPLKSHVNARLIELVDLFWAAVDSKRKLLKLRSIGEHQHGSLSDDLARLRERSRIAEWSVRVMLETALPLLDVIQSRSQNGREVTHDH